METITNLLIISLFTVLICSAIYDHIIKSFKIAYYEQKLENRGVDIDYVKNITIKQIITD